MKPVERVEEVRISWSEAETCQDISCRPAHLTIESAFVHFFEGFVFSTSLEKYIMRPTYECGLNELILAEMALSVFHGPLGKERRLMWIDPDAYHYLPIVILMSVGAIIGTALIGINALFGRRPKNSPSEKYDVYECGVPTVGNARQQFSVRYYVVGIVFLLFDVEVVFMYPWAVVYKRFLTQGHFILTQMILFFVILLAGYAYLLGRKGLDWE